MGNRKNTLILISIFAILSGALFVFESVFSIGFQNDLNMGQNRISNVGMIGTDDSEAATKSYIDSTVSGFGGGIDGSGTLNYIAKWSDYNTLMDSTIRDNGSRVGIGKDPSTTYRLDTNGNIRATRYYGDGSSLTGISTGQWHESGTNWIYPNNTNNVVISPGGNVGIGSSGPFEKLEVWGDIMVDGAIYARDSTGVGLSDQYGYSGLWVKNGGQVGAALFSDSPNYGLDLEYYNNLNASSYYQNGQKFEGEVWKRTPWGSAIYYNSGDVAIGKTYADYRLDVAGDINAGQYFEKRYGSAYHLGMWRASGSDIYYNDPVAIGGVYDPHYACSLDVKGKICGTTKAFVIPHPIQPGKKLVHSSLEGPETAVFYRGEGQLQDGKAVIELPDYFEALTREEGRTVLVTSKFETEEEPISGLFVLPVKNGRFTVKAADTNNPQQKFLLGSKGRQG